MRYVIVGCGRVGSTLAKLLAAEHHDVSVVDEFPAAFKRLGQNFPGSLELGTGIDSDVLKRAGTEGADGFVAVTDGDNRNVMAALIAQRIFGVKKIVARIYDPPRGSLYRELGIETVCPTTIGASIIRDKLLGAPPEARPAFDFGPLTSLALLISATHAGKLVSEIERDGRIRVTAIRRASRVFIAQSNDRLQLGDEINLVVSSDALAEFALNGLVKLGG